jgi:hypothetical protein
MNRAVSLQKLTDDFQLTYNPIEIDTDNFICVTTMDRHTLEVNAKKLPHYVGCAIMDVEKDDKHTFRPQQWKSITDLVNQVRQGGGTVDF